MKHEYKCIRQIEETDCGAACIATVCNYYGKSVDILAIRSMAMVDRYGATMLGLYKASEKLGFHAEGLFGNIQELFSEKLPLPCIAHVVIDQQLEHYVVIFEITDQTIVVGDPAKGIQVYSTSTFEQIWTGHILSLKPDKLPEQRQKKDSVLLPFFKMAGIYKRKFAVIAFLSLCVTALSVVASFFNYYLIDFIIPYKFDDKLTSLSVAVIIGNIIILIVNLLRTRIIANVSKRISTDIMCRYVEHLLNVEYGFYNQHTSGDMISRLEDSNIVREAISKVIMTITFDLVMAIVCLMVLAYLDTSLFILAFIVAICYVFSVAKFSRNINNTAEGMRRKDALASTTFFETVRGVETIKSYEYEREAYKKNASALTNLMDSYKNLSIILSTQTYLSECIVAMGDILILAFGGHSVMNGKITFGILFMFYSLLNMSLMPMKNIVDLFPSVEQARVSARRLNSVFSHPCEDKGQTGTTKISGSISIKHLCFRYGSRDLILDDFSLEINGGEKLALMGGSGAGKSTLAKILLRLYEAESGEINISGVPLRDIGISELRAKIAYVPQNPYVFGGSLLDNISVGNIKLAPTEVIRRINETPLKHFIDQFPMGYDSIITESGENLSGGQKQMIAIARAIVKHGDILILDEAYNSIDSNLKEVAKKSINLVYKEATCILITHNPAEVQECNRIVTMDSKNYGI